MPLQLRVLAVFKHDLILNIAASKLANPLRAFSIGCLICVLLHLLHDPSIRLLALLPHEASHDLWVVFEHLQCPTVSFYLRDLVTKFRNVFLELLPDSPEYVIGNLTQPRREPNVGDLKL